MSTVKLICAAGPLPVLADDEITHVVIRKGRNEESYDICRLKFVGYIISYCHDRTLDYIAQLNKYKHNYNY